MNNAVDKYFAGIRSNARTWNKLSVVSSPAGIS